MIPKYKPTVAKYLDRIDIPDKRTSIVWLETSLGTTSVHIDPLDFDTIANAAREKFSAARLQTVRFFRGMVVVVSGNAIVCSLPSFISAISWAMSLGISVAI